MATDFIGFTIGGHHSSDLGILRVSGGDRYNENLLPTSQDKTVQVPGGDGTYYFGSYYTQNAFSIEVAFDSLSEAQFRNLRAILGSKKIQDFVFDERPYKTYKVKSSGTPQIKYICFGDDRVYKGEGTFQFVAYEPFAHCPSDYKYLDQYSITTDTTTGSTIYSPSWYRTDNKTEWALSTTMLSEQDPYDDFGNNSYARVYNPGDMATDFTMTIGSGATAIALSPNTSAQSVQATLVFTTALPADMKYDSKLNLLTYATTDTIANQYVKSGTFFKIPIVTGSDEMYIVVNGGSGSNLKYDYLYF